MISNSPFGIRPAYRSPYTQSPGSLAVTQSAAPSNTSSSKPGIAPNQLYAVQPNVYSPQTRTELPQSYLQGMTDLVAVSSAAIPGERSNPMVHNAPRQFTGMVVTSHLAQNSGHQNAMNNASREKDDSHLAQDSGHQTARDNASRKTDDLHPSSFSTFSMAYPQRHNVMMPMQRSQYYSGRWDEAQINRKSYPHSPGHSKGARPALAAPLLFGRGDARNDLQEVRERDSLTKAYFGTFPTSRPFGAPPTHKKRWHSVYENSLLQKIVPFSVASSVSAFGSPSTHQSTSATSAMPKVHVFALPLPQSHSRMDFGRPMDLPKDCGDPPVSGFHSRSDVNTRTNIQSNTKTNSSKLTRTNLVPPELPPSVEAAYRLKCIQLKTRLNEVEEANDASRLRIERLNRTIYKGRLERAFLLEQLAKRTSTNVEDSEGSPSPPPTPKEKPLRIKRGHRKPDFLTTDMDGRVGTTFANQGPVTLSPSSDAFSHTHPDHFRNSTPQGNSSFSNKRHLPSNENTAPNLQPQGLPMFRPRNTYERRDLNKDDGEVEAILAGGWAAANNGSARFEDFRKLTEGERENGSRPPVAEGEQRLAEPTDEDVEMEDDLETPAPAPSSGFTAVNN